MRMLGVLSDQEQAGRFGDYLLSREIENQVEPASGGWRVWVVNDDKLAPAQAELKAFEADPDAEQFKAAGPYAKRIREEKERKARQRAEMEVDVRTQWFSGVMRPTPVTILLIAGSFLIGLVTRVGNWDNHEPDVVSAALLFCPPGEHRAEMLGMWAILHGEVWRLFTSMFIHYGIFHLLFNMLWMVDLGIPVERKRGTLWFVLFVLGAAAVSNVSEHFVTIDLMRGGIFFNQGYPYTGGMSGVLYALFGYVWIRGRVAPHDKLGVSSQTRTIMLVWLFGCMTGILGPIGNTAHLMGMVFGMAVAYAPAAMRRLRQM